MTTSPYLLTVFTPAYNRAHTIGRTYESLCRQTSKNFCWLIIDDGSSDNTKVLVEGWIKENRVPITYIYQENQGMHGAHNTAYDNIHTELNTCIDSDDYMPDNAVHIIEEFWMKNRSRQYSGIIGLDFSVSGELIGDRFPDNIKSITRTEIIENGIKGDKKVVLRTDAIQAIAPCPLFENEKYLGPGCREIQLDLKYSMLVINEPLVIVDYQMDGSSMSLYRLYWNNPKGFAYGRKIDMQFFHTFKQRMKTHTHYVASSIIAKNRFFLKESPQQLWTFFAIIPGILLYLFIRHQVHANKSFKIKK